MSENIYYLRNGEEVILHQRIDENTFVVERMVVYHNYDGDEECEPSGEKTIVKEIFKTPPVEKKQEEFNSILDKIDVKNNELRGIENQLYAAKRELSNCEKQTTDIKKLIINKGELKKAERISFFDKGKPCAPLSISKEEGKSLMLTYRLEVNGDDERAWSCGVDYDGRRGSSDSVDMEYGLIINATDEKLIEISKERLKKLTEIRDWDLNRTDNKYLTEELVKRKLEYEKNQKTNEIDSLEAEIKSKKEKVRKLRNA